MGSCNVATAWEKAITTVERDLAGWTFPCPRCSTPPRRCGTSPTANYRTTPWSTAGCPSSPTCRRGPIRAGWASTRPAWRGPGPRTDPCLARDLRSLPGAGVRGGRGLPPARAREAAAAIPGPATRRSPRPATSGSSPTGRRSARCSRLLLAGLTSQARAKGLRCRALRSGGRVARMWTRASTLGALPGRATGVRPPSTARAWPVTKLDPSPASHKAASATSMGRPARRIGARSLNTWDMASTVAWASSPSSPAARAKMEWRRHPAGWR